MTEASGSEMYRQSILDHYKNPENYGTLDPCDVRHLGENPLCGDTLDITVRVDKKGLVTDAKFSGQGCAISQASTDILLSHIKGKTLDQILAFGHDDLVKLLGIQVSPVRLKCAVLGLMVVHDGIKIQRGEMPKVDVTRTED